MASLVLLLHYPFEFWPEVNNFFPHKKSESQINILGFMSQSLAQLLSSAIVVGKLP